LLPGFLQAVAGLGLISATVTYLLRVREDRKRRDRQRKGLLRLLGYEIKRNEWQLRQMSQQPNYITAAPDYAITATAWEDARSTLAPLLEDEKQLFDIANYYSVIQAVNSHRVERILLINSGASAPEEQAEFSRQIPRLLELTDKALNPIRAYFPDEKALTGATPKTLDNVNEADAETEDRNVDS
jgi:hypothetical protein